jgi:prepilin-type N-terminal cleavage/methylation domain-containing protein
MHAFTLIEMLVSIAVLSLLVVALCTIINSTSATLGTSWSRLQSDEDGRLVLDRLQIDLQNMLIRPDIDYDFIQNTGPGNDWLGFYASEPGYTTPTGTTKRVMTVIDYQTYVNPTTLRPTLERGSNDIFQWASGTSGMIFSSNPTIYTTSSTQTGGSTIYSLEAEPNDTTKPTDILSNAVFRFEVSYLVQIPASQNTSRNLNSSNNPVSPVLLPYVPAYLPISDVVAIVVTIAELDTQNSKIVPNSSWATLVAALPDATGSITVTGAGGTATYNVTAGTSTALAWNNAITGNGFAATAGIPQKAASAIRIYERYFYLTTPPSQAAL